jgi:putative peptide zinc metalloprotease protein
VQYVAGLINLVPFARFDGYFALMSHLDIPHLRDRAITDARRSLARLLFGGRYDRALERRWSVPFGLACLLFPAYLLGTALVTWSGLLQRFGVAGAILLCCLLSYLAYLTVSGSIRLVREALRAGAAVPRICAMMALAVVAFGAVLTWLPVPHTVSGGYVRHGDRFELVLPDGADRTAVRRGAQVRLLTAGVVTRARTGTATIADARGTRTCAPAAAFVPLTLDPAACVPATAYPLTVTEAPEPASGMATVDGGSLHLGRLLLDTLLAGWKW